MTVERLIKELQKYNPKAEVKLHTISGESVLFVLGYIGDNKSIFLETESDTDMHSELEARFKYASEFQMDELDFYMDLLEVGIDIEMVQKYMGEEIASHMREFCEEHGLI